MASLAAQDVMDFLLWVAFAATLIHIFNLRQQRLHMGLLGRHLQPYPVERLMGSLIDGYLRAMGEADAQRRQQVFQMLEISEVQLSEQFAHFVADFRQLPAEVTRVSRLPLALPFVTQIFPAAALDMRKLLAVHADGIAYCARNEGRLSARDKGFMMTAELLLMQHSCHWYCRSKTIASARVLARHQSTYEQILDAVSPVTRQAYLRLLD